MEPFEERLCPSGDFSAVADFSNVANPSSSTWSYRFSADLNRDGSYELLNANSDPTSLWNPATPYWNFNNSQLPGVGVNSLGRPISNANVSLPFTWPNNTVWMHPNFGGLVVVSWLSPTTGVVDLEFSFADMDPNGGNGIRYFVDRNDSTPQLASDVLPNGGTSGLLTLTNVAVSTGHRINFLVDPNGDHTFDSTAFTARVLNRPPVANNDTASLNTAAVTIPVLANDADANGDPLQVTAVTQGQNGAVTINQDGTVTYRLTRFISGPDTFSYTISDGRGGTATATVTVAVAAQDPALGIALVRAQIGGLPLLDGERQSLTSKLDAAGQSVSADRPAAANQLGAFINEVQALRSTGRLAPALADLLILQIQAVIGLLA